MQLWETRNATKYSSLGLYSDKEFACFWKYPIQSSCPDDIYKSLSKATDRVAYTILRQLSLFSEVGVAAAFTESEYI